MSNPKIVKVDGYSLEKLNREVEELGFKLSYSPHTESTMQIIDQLAQKRMAEKIAALTDHQFKGEGRYSRVWHDTAGKSILFSLLLHAPQDSIATIADLAAISICASLRKCTGLSLKIKYPNDIIFEKKKLGGILVRNIYDPGLNHLGINLGVGINVHYTIEELKSMNTDYPVSSLDRASNSFYKRQDLFVEILKGLRYIVSETQIFMSNPNTRKPFETSWKSLSATLGKTIAIEKNDKIIERGKVLDTAIGSGILLKTTKNNKKWFALYECDMKARIIN